MKRYSLIFVTIAAAACVLAYFHATGGNFISPPRNLATFLYVIVIIAPYFVIVLGGLPASRLRIKPGLIVGCALATGIVAGLVSSFFLALEWSEPETPMTTMAKSMPDYHAPIDPSALLLAANLALFMAAVGTWLWKRKEMGTLSVWQGIGLGLLYWGLLILMSR